MNSKNIKRFRTDKQNPGLEKSQENSFCPFIEIKEELEIKDEPLDVKEEFEGIGVHDAEKNSGSDEIQTSNRDVNYVEENYRLKMEKSLGNKPETSKGHNQMNEEKDFKDFCSTSFNSNFKSQDELQTHFKSLNKKFRCLHCNYQCSHELGLKIHLLKHSDFKFFKCSECNNVFNNITDLKSHVLTHANFKLFKCSECSYESNHKGTLKSHMLTHANFKLFKCSECSYECNRKSFLKTHMLSHSKIKLFKCSECSYGCNRKGDFKKHTSIHTKRKVKCSECSYECNHNGRFRKHMLKQKIPKQ